MADKGNIWELLGKSVKWEEVVRHGPKIVEAARILYENSRQRQQRSGGGPAPGPEVNSGRLADLEADIRRLQENEIEQAGLVADIAGQLESLTRSVDALGSRVQKLLWLGGGALVVSLAALALSLVN